MGNSLAQASKALAGRESSPGKALSVHTQGSSEEATQGEGRSVASTNPFWARLTA